jgi:hypothetical protein
LELLEITNLNIRTLFPEFNHGDRRMDFYVIMSISINSEKGVNVGAVNDVFGDENSH